MSEFTGERVIPDEVDVDLLNEHMARYTFAARLARGKRVLDAGCGAGYGSVELAHLAQSVAGVDRAPEAINYARGHYSLPNLFFTQASCTAMPFPGGAFDLVVAFEVIEHLEDWREFLLESRRVLSANGQFVVSTPNKLYYTESRGSAGVNPFHTHEFSFEEFCGELRNVFPHVSMFLENHVEGVAFQPHEAGQTVEVRVDAGEPAPNESHFFLAVCAHRPQVGNPTFVYVPRAANVLRERERHIALLEGEVATKNGWLERAKTELAELDRAHVELEGELKQSNEWAQTLEKDLQERRDRVVALQEELASTVAGYESKIKALEDDIHEKTEWAIQLEKDLTGQVRALKADVEKQTADLLKAVEALHKTESELDERTAWALRLQEEANQLAHQVALFRASRWVKLGHKVGLGPTLPAA